jgi:hypothetical protein
VWNFAPPSAPKATVDRDQAAATALFRHAPTWPSNSLIDNQFLVFRSAANACVIAATTAVFLRKFMLFLRFLRRPLLFDPQPRITIVII